jgi:hypothetical protein
MEATSRPPLESLPDLPVEEPADAVASASSTRTGREPAHEPPAEFDPASTQTLLQPDALLAVDDEPTIPAIAEGLAPEAHQVLEVDPDAPLRLDSGLEVDRMLSGSPAPSRPAQPPALRAAPVEVELTLFPDTAARAKTPAPAAAPRFPAPSPAPAARGGDAAPLAAPALVPLARRASISAAAEKLAAAAAAAAAATPPQGVTKPPPPVAPAPPAAPVRPRTAPM